MSSRVSWEDFRKRERLVGPLPSGGDPLWALAFPQGYDVGMANLGMHSVYRALRERGVAVERFFRHPFPEISVESDRPARDFRLLTASVAYEPDMLTLLDMLKQWGIPRTWRQRLDWDGPLLGVGGGISYINPLGLSRYADFIALGDGEELYDHLVDSVRIYFQAHGNRRRFWESLSESPYFLVPPIHLEPLLQGKGIHRVKSICNDMAKVDGKSTWITPRSVFPETFLIETQRGCCRNCRFCTIPGCFGHPRMRPVENVLKDIALAEETGASRIGIIAPESGDYPWIEKVLGKIQKDKCSVSFASLRIDSLSDKILSVLAESGQRTLTVAPETGDDELRKSCGKDFTREDIIKKLLRAKEKGMQKVKMYFMIGLPREAEKHILETARLIHLIRKETALKTVASLSVFVPKPQTAWWNEEFAPSSDIRAKTSILREYLSKSGAQGIALRLPSYREAAREYRLAWSQADTDLGAFQDNTGWNDIARVAGQLELVGSQCDPSERR
ncbi:MAG: B12-binding domain-containing radical SAM protein [Thermovirgaceae bacterium]